MPRAVCFRRHSVTFHIFKKWRGGGDSDKGQRLTFPPAGDECQGNDVAASAPLIPMKITGWQGGCHPRLPPPASPTDNYRSSGLVAALLLSVEIASCCLRAPESDFN